MPYVDVAPGVRMAYEDRGTGCPLVFVHGWGGSGDVWDYQVLDLADRFRVITVDLRGHGASDKPWGDYGYATFCADLATLMRELSLEDVTLVGWSMGGHIGLKFVQTIGAPVARLVLTGSGPRLLQAADAPYGGPEGSAQALCDAVRFSRVETIQGLYGRNFHRTDLAPTRDWMIRIGLQVSAFVGLKSFEALLAEDLRPGLADLTIPVAVFCGRHDEIWDPWWSEAAAKDIPGASLTYFENSGHVPFIEERAAWSAALAEFVTGG
ncbi:alpha/beta hydrolase [Streptomyces sp. NBC_00117]|uniref:alpha/beta fold hydrolase n=1 Tax=unclassified Streptomyces TaxID=2593676 RepID=UPI002252262C|nr:MULTISPECIES: alpha/beta hydrolase [unclassified Streptomyces]MCX5435695.1 alpha/beta hydrolase [Streptomyces sp. NBC_00063]WSE08776.1 alpha/beta hydrolase [Streptomyces sp. NBC_01445]